MSLSKEEIQRYSRHIRLSGIGTEGQEKLKNTRVLMIGAGGLGCPVLQYLCAAGIGTIGILDDDHVDISNLQRQILYTVNDVDHPKAEAAKDRLAALNPFVDLVVHNTRLTRENALDICKDYDILIDGTDNFATRYLTSDVSVILDKPLVFGSIFKFEGQVSVFNYQGGPSYRCLYPEMPNPADVPNCSEVGVFGVLPGVVGARMANECLKMILGVGEVLSGKLAVMDLLANTEFILKITKDIKNFERFELEKSYEYECEVPVALPFDMTPREVKEIMQTGDVQLIDVREPWEYDLCQIQGSESIPLHEIVRLSHLIDPHRPAVFICHHGVRSKMAIDLLQQKGFTKLHNLMGGIDAWALEVDEKMDRY